MGAPAADVLVGGASAGPVTVAVGLLVSCRGVSSLVQMAPAVLQDRWAGNVMTTSLSSSGSAVISQRSLRPSTRFAVSTSPLVTVNASSRMFT